MSGVEVSSEEFCKRLTETQKREVKNHLSNGLGVALFADASGAPRLIRSYGPRGADIVGLPPKGYGQSDWELAAYCPPQKVAGAMKSPVMDWEPPRQITAPPRGQSRTEVPEVLIAGRTPSHPRGNSEYISPSAPRQPVQPPAPQRELTASEEWWAKHL
jgi:hypothetical protein